MPCNFLEIPNKLLLLLLMITADLAITTDKAMDF